MKVNQKDLCLSIIIFYNKQENSMLVLAGDIHQIESINFGNWFFYAKEIIKTKGANVGLLKNTWRTDDENLKDLWNEVRHKGNLITEKLVIDGPYSENIGQKVLESYEKDEVIFCLNYEDGIYFTIDVDLILTEISCKKEEIDFIETIDDDTTRIGIKVYKHTQDSEESVEVSQRDSIIPFQLAYAVSIHKAKGLEYNSVKIIIPSSNSEKIIRTFYLILLT